MTTATVNMDQPCIEVVLQVNDDIAAEADEMFAASSHASSTAGVTSGRVSATILNDDSSSKWVPPRGKT